MAQLRLGHAEIQKRGAEILQVTHSTPEEARVYFGQHQIAFPYLCDPDREVHRLYGIPLAHPGIGGALRLAAASAAATVRDQLLEGERTPSPFPYLKRHGLNYQPDQAVFIVDRAGIIRYVYSAGPTGAIPSNADLLRELASLA